jgi:hypothetical protein
MNLSDKKVSEAIAAVVGVEYIQSRENEDGILFSASFSAFTPDSIWQWKAYLKKEMPVIWVRYCRGMRIPEHEGLPFCTAERIVERVDNPHELVKWLKNNLDGWGYEECKRCSGTKTIYHNSDVGNRLVEIDCPDCNGTGKVITEKGKRFKEVVEKGE